MFTLNNPEMDEEELMALFKRVGVKVLVFQLEKGEETGTLHYQGYVSFNVVKRLTAVKKILPRAHWEPRIGTPKQCINYCTKEETRYGGPWRYDEKLPAIIKTAEALGFPWDKFLRSEQGMLWKDEWIPGCPDEWKKLIMRKEMGEEMYKRVTGLSLEPDSDHEGEWKKKEPAGVAPI